MTKVVVAMSGGLDSSVAAALLKRAGFALRQAQGNPEPSRRIDVVGVFMKFWSAPHHFEETSKYKLKSLKDGISNDKFTSDQSGGGWNRCCSPEAEVRARKVAKILKIPFYVLNFEKEFKKRIVDYFLEEHKKGRTPNPCVVCNKEIKFGLLLEKALKLEADFVATGHYARKNELTTNNLQPTTYKLLRAKDKNKDQSYFLWMLNQKQLKRILFPIGDYTREEVEKLAKKFNLPVLKARKSVEICFIQTTINDFLKKYLKEKPGEIVDTEGKVIGEHQGLWFYTVGQRKGLGLAGGPAFTKVSAGKPYYVSDKDLKKNLLIVTKNEKDLYKKELICEKVNWISGKEPRLRRGFGGQAKLPLKVKAKIRYRHQLAPATIIRLRSKVYSLKFKIAQKAITPGQSVVFYKDDEILGGGIIC